MIDINNKGSIIRILYNQLRPETLESVIEEFVTRDGTDYGGAEISLERKIDQVKRRLKSGQAVILFDESTKTCNIFSKSDPRVKNLEI